MSDDVRSFRLILAASFVSQAGSHLLTIALATQVLVTTADPVKASLVFVLSFLPAALISRWAGGVVERHASRRFLVLNDLGAAVISLACGAGIAGHAPLALVALLLGARSIASFLQRAAMSKCLKAISPPALAPQRFQLFLLGFFLATAASGLTAAATLGPFGIWGIVAIDVSTFGIAILIESRLQLPLMHASAAQSASGGSVNLRKLIQGNRGLRFSVASLCLSQMLFQGAYSILVTFLPIRKFALGSGGTGYFQLAASAGIIGGYILNRIRPGLFFGGDTPRAAITSIPFLLGLGAAIGACVVGSATPSALLFMAMNFAYEAAWLASSAYSFRVVPSSSTAGFQFVQTSLAALLMSIWTFLLAYAITLVGVEQAVAALTTAGVLLWAVVALPQARSPGSSARAA